MASRSGGRSDRPRRCVLPISSSPECAQRALCAGGPRQDAPGQINQGRVCKPVSVACKPSDVLLGGRCEPKPTNCPAGTFQPIAGAPCQTNGAGADKTPSVTCNPNEMLVAGRCEPKLANCPNNTVRLASGECKPLSPACKPDKITVGGYCEKPAICPSGRHRGPLRTASARRAVRQRPFGTGGNPHSSDASRQALRVRGPWDTNTPVPLTKIHE
jgi:hypothetical protein